MMTFHFFLAVNNFRGFSNCPTIHLILLNFSLLLQWQMEGASLYWNKICKYNSNISLRDSWDSNYAPVSMTINSNDSILYNNSFDSKGLFSQEKRICLNYNKGLLCSINGMKDKQRNFSFTSFLFSDSIFSLSPLVPVKVYYNAETCRLEILKENKGRAGIYRFTNILNGKTYVGSSVELRNRFLHYYRLTYLANKRRGQSMICKALLKNGYNNFTLEILEYCDPSEAILREQYYIDLLKPGYNILKFAGSTLGYKHSEDTKAKLSSVLKAVWKSEISDMLKAKLSASWTEERRLKMILLKEGKTLSEETRAKISAALKEVWQSEEKRAKYLASKKKKDVIMSEETKAKISATKKGVKKSEETKAKMSAAHMGNKHGPGYHGQIEILDMETGIKTVYASMSELSKALSIPKSSISAYFSRNIGKPYKGRYMMTKVN